MAQTPSGPWKYVQDREQFELVSVNHSARSGVTIGLSFRFSLTGRYVVCSH